MEINKIKEKIDLENQFDVELQGCSTDCKEYYGKTSFEVNLIESQGVNDTDPTGADTREVVRIASALGIPPCWAAHTSKTNLYL